MSFDDFRASLLEEIEGVLGYDFDHIISTTDQVPTIEDQGITYPNLIERSQRSKLITTAVLFVDLRNSTSISLNHNQESLSQLYSVYVRAMTRCAHYFHGKVRNIIGDRVMVVFDRQDCYINAVNTAMLMNTVANHILNAEVPGICVEVGIGIDFGEMLVTKTGIIKRGSENTSNKSLVWLGKPANVASKLTDLANKKTEKSERYIKEGHFENVSGPWTWVDVSMEQFVNRLRVSLRKITHESPTFGSFFTTYTIPKFNPPILMTKSFYEGLSLEHPYAKSVTEEFWKERDLSVPGYNGEIYGGHGYFPAVAAE